MKSLLLPSLFLMLTVLACSPLAFQASNQGNQAFGRNNFEAASSSYTRAQSISLENAELHYNQGNAYYRQSQFLEAKQEYQQALLNANEALAQKTIFNLGNAYFNSFEFTRAIESYKQVLRMNPDNIAAKHNLELSLTLLVKEVPAGSQEVQQEVDDPNDGGEDSEEEDTQSAEEQNNQDDPGEEDDENPPPPEGLNEEQARQLLESVGQDTETLRDRTQQVYVVPSDAPGKDW